METQADKTPVYDGIEISTDFSDNEWKSYVDSAADAVPAHLLEWRDLFYNIFDYQPIYLAARRNGEICGVLPAFDIDSLFLGKHIISVPFLNSGGISARDEAAFSALMNEARNITSYYKARHFEMRCSYPPPNGVPARQHKIRIVMDLPTDPDELWSSLRSEIRNRTRHARSAGLGVEFNSSQVREFYSVFAENMHEIGVPVHPRRFFEAVLGAFPDTAELVVVKESSHVIGGAITFRFRDTLEVPWISCSRKHFSSCPNNILYWEIMRKACIQGIKTFDFGRSSPGTGPAAFKLRWGAHATQLYWHYVLREGKGFPSEVGTGNPKFKLASTIWSKLPSVITNTVGPRLIAHLPG